MNKSLRWKLAFYVAALVISLGIIMGLAFYTWQEMGTWRAEFSVLQYENMRLADELQSNVFSLNSHLAQFSREGKPEARNQFEREISALKKWLLNQHEKSRSKELKTILAQTMQLIETYEKQGSDLFGMPTGSDFQNVRHDLLRQMDATSFDLLQLDRKLSLHLQESFHRLLDDMGNVVAQFRIMAITTFGLLLLFTVMGAVSVYREIIRPLRVQLIETRRRAERQEKLSSLGLLAAGVAHEIRNPLTSIKARNFTQRKALAAGSPAFEDNTFIGNELQRLHQIVNEILEFARPAEPRLEKIRPSELLKETLGLVVGEIPADRIEVRLEILADPPIEVDIPQMKQILLNLIKNAAESISGKGVITLRTRARPGRAKSRSSFSVFEVEDTGAGIPVESQRRLFDPFFSTKESGTGLGLSIVARIVEAHHGHLEFQTEAGHGTTFRVLLPISPHENRKDIVN